MMDGGSQRESRDKGMYDDGNADRVFEAGELLEFFGKSWRAIRRFIDWYFIIAGWIKYELGQVSISQKLRPPYERELRLSFGLWQSPLDFM